MKTTVCNSCIKEYKKGIDLMFTMPCREIDLCNDKEMIESESADYFDLPVKSLRAKTWVNYKYVYPHPKDERLRVIYLPDSFVWNVHFAHWGRDEKTLLKKAKTHEIINYLKLKFLKETKHDNTQIQNQILKRV